MGITDGDGEYNDGTPEVNIGCPLERALHRFGFSTLAARLQHSADTTESRFTDLELRINDALCEYQHAVYNVKMKQDTILIRLSAMEDASKQEDAGSIQSSSKVTPGKVNEDQQSFKSDPEPGLQCKVYRRASQSVDSTCTLSGRLSEHVFAPEGHHFLCLAPERQARTTKIQEGPW